MSSQFESNLETLVAHSVSEAHVRLKNNDEEYNEESARMSDIREEMEKLFEEKELGTSSSEFSTNSSEFKTEFSHFEIVKEYFELDQDTYSLEHEATYFQGVYDCIKVLTKLGWINK